MKDLSRYINKVPVKVELDTSMEKILAIQLLYKQTIDIMDTIEGGSVINVKSNWEAEAGSESEILNKPNLATVATTGSFTDLLNKPTSLKTFKESWHTDTTLLELCQDIVADADVRVGDVFLGQVTCIGLPEGMMNGEVEIMVKEGGNDDKLLFITITSTNLSPYHWETTYYNNTLSWWKCWLEDVNEDQLFTNTVSTEQKKQAALMQVLMLEQMYGYTSTTTTNPEYEAVILDSEDRILAGKKVNGKTVLFGVEYD